MIHFTLDTYLILPSVKQGGFKYHFKSLWYDATWDWTQVSRTINQLPTNYSLTNQICISIQLCVSKWFISNRIIRVWSAIWKSELTDKMKRGFFQAAVVSILQYGCTILTRTKRTKKKLDSNYTRMQRAILNKSRRPHLIKQQLCSHLPPITKTIQVRRTLLEKQGRAHKGCSPIDLLTWPSKSRATSSNLYTATLWGYRM